MFLEERRNQREEERKDVGKPQNSPKKLVGVNFKEIRIHNQNK